MKKLIPITLTIAMMITIPLKAKDYIYSEHFPVLPQPWYFGMLYAMDIGPDGNLYIANSNRITIFTPDGVLLRQFKYFLEREPHYPRVLDAIAVGPSGTIYAGDWNEGKILKINPQGEIMAKIFYYRYDGDLTTDAAGNLYFSDRHANDDDWSQSQDSVFKLDPDGNVLLSFGAPATSTPEAALPSPMDIRVDSSGNIYVSDGGLLIKIFDTSGNYMRTIDFSNFGFGPYESPASLFGMVSNIIYSLGYSEILKIGLDGNLIARYPYSNPIGPWSAYRDIAGANGKLYLLSSGLSRVELYNTEGTFISNWQSWGHNPCEFYGPYGIDVDHAQNVYVCDTGNNRIQVFDRNWNLKMIIGSAGSGPGEFKKPRGVAVDDEGNIYVADKGNFRVQKFNKRGEFVLEWGSEGTAGGQFLSMNDIAIDRDGYVYVLDDDKETVKKFTNDGQFITEIGNDLYFDFPSGIAVDDTGILYIVQSSDDVFLFSTDGAFMDKWWLPDGVLSYNVAVSHDGKVFFTDPTHDQFLVYDRDGHFLGSFGSGNDPVKNLYGAGPLAISDQGEVIILSGGSRVVVYRPTPGAPRTIPAAASTTGANGTHWRSDVTLFNPGDETINLDLSFLQAQTQTPAAVTLDPLESLTLPDLIANLFDSPESFGAVTSTNFESIQPLIVSRTYNRTNDGTFGQGIRASPYEATFYEGERAYLTGLKQSETFRTNVGFVNLLDFPIDLTLTLHDEAGEVLGEGEYTLPAYGHKQVNAIFNALAISEDHVAAWAEVYTETPGGRFTTYASIVDNRSGDPLYIEGEGLGERSPDDWELLLPVVASAPGAYGTRWRTEAVLTNLFVEPMEVQLTYHPADGSGPYTHTLSLQPGEVFQADDLLSVLFSLDNTFGYLAITTNATGLQVRGRIATGEGEGGSYGQGIPARRIKACEQGASPLYLLNLKENAAFRSNAGFINLSEDAIVMTLDLIGNGQVLASKTQSVPARSLIQINSVLSVLFGVTGENYTLRITAPENALYTAYLSTVDNATGDPVFASGQSR